MRTRRLGKTLGPIAIALAVTWATNALAEEQQYPARCGHCTTRGKFWATLPLTELVWVNPGASGGGGAVALGGLSLELELQRFWAVEIGAASVFTSIEGTGRDAFLRAGVVPVLYDGTRSDGRGWTIQFDALAGYRFLDRFDAPDGHPGTERTHGVAGNFGFEFNRQFESLGIGARVLSGVTVPFAQTRTEYWESHSYIERSQDLRWALDLGVDFGITL